MAGKEFTLENLRADNACPEGLAFVTPIIEAGGCVASALLDRCHDGWFMWAIAKGYNVEPARRAWRTWDSEGRVHTTAGDGGTATAGDGGTATAGGWGTAAAGHGGTATAGDGGTATAGGWGTATAGGWGTATAGNWGTAAAGHGGTATAGDGGTATAGGWGTATAGGWGTIVIKRWDGTRYRLVVGYIGEDGLKPNTPYKLDDDGKFVEACK